MRPPRRPRTLSGEESRLWGEVAKLIKPLRGRAKPAERSGGGVADEPASPSPAILQAAPGPAARLAASAKKTAARAVPTKRLTTLADLSSTTATSPAIRPAPLLVVAPPPPLTPGLERRVRLALRRGALRVDARIDLHGMYQGEAHGALVGFLMRARAAGHTHVLVVTGKGGATCDEAFSERGVLRRVVPHWLRSSELRAVVLGFEEAARHHGGAGALYVRLRRR